MSRAWAIKLGSGGRCVPFCEERSIVGIGWAMVDPEIAARGTREDIRRHITKVCTWYKTERDLEAALRSNNRPMEVPEPDFYAFRLHLCASPELLARIDKHMNAVLDLLTPNEKTSSKFGPDDQHVSLTLALFPIKG